MKSHTTYKHHLIGLWMLTALWCCGCYPYAPPVRTGMGGSPPIVQKGNTLLSFNATRPAMGDQLGADGNLGFALSEHVVFETGLSTDVARSTMGFVGPRFIIGSPSASVRMDVELGGGLGIGGGAREDVTCDWFCPEDYDQHTTMKWYERFARGAYGGIGVGMYTPDFSVFSRFRYQMVAATELPLTHLLLGAFGIESTPGDFFKIHFILGPAAYVNEHRFEKGFLYELGVTFHFK